VIGTPEPGQRVERGLIDGAFVTVLVEGIQPITVLGIPRAAVMSDQSGSYVFVVGADGKVERRPIKLGQSTATLAVITDGLKQGEQIIVEGLQRARPGIVVKPGPVGPQPGGPPAGGPQSGGRG
jgi:membrane fusion protein, multidrug efflux system